MKTTERREDRRVRRTKQNLLAAMARLLQEKPLSGITVRELCEQADIHKSTFYLHYKDIYDCAASMYAGIIKKMTDLLGQYTREEQRAKLPELLKKAVGIYGENIETYQPFLKNASQAPVVYGIRQAVMQYAVRLGSPREQADPMFCCGVAFVVAGLFGMIELCAYEDLSDDVITRIGESIQWGFWGAE